VTEPDTTPADPRRLTAGIAFLHRQPLISAVVATVATNNLFRNVAMGVAVLYLVDTGGLEPAAIGAAFALGNSGFIVGAVLPVASVVDSGWATRCSSASPWSARRCCFSRLPRRRSPG
jgi:predicted acylesterase/phospholipase RssA